MCENGGGRPGLPVPNPYGLCGRKATLKLEASHFNIQSATMRVT